MLRIRFAILALIVLSACAPLDLKSQTPPDTCWVEGYLFGNDMKIARTGTVVIKRIEKPGYLFTFRPPAEVKADPTGFVRIPLPRGSTAYLYSQHIYSISRDQTNGTPIPIPDAPSARLENLPPTTAVPTSHIVAVPLLLVKGSSDSANVKTLQIDGADVTFDGTSQATVTIAAPEAGAPYNRMYEYDTTKNAVVFTLGRFPGTVTFTQGSDTLRGHGTRWVTGTAAEILDGWSVGTGLVRGPDSLYYVGEWESGMALNDTTAILARNDLGDGRWDKSYIWPHPTVTVPYDNATQPTAWAGDKSFTFAVNGMATGARSVAMGYNAFSRGDQSLALHGDAKGMWSISIGTGSEATHGTSVAVGAYAKAMNGSAIALGEYSYARGSKSMALNRGDATGENSNAIGEQAFALGQRSTAIAGQNVKAIGTGSFAAGQWTLAPSQYSAVFGRYNDTTGEASTPRIFTVGVGTYWNALANGFIVYADGSLGGHSAWRGVAVIGTGDSVRVPITGMTHNDVVTLAYRGGKTAHTAGETILSYAVFSSSYLTIFGKQGRTVAWVRIR